MLEAEQKEKEKERAKVLKEEERARKKEEKARRKAEKEAHSKDAAAVGADDTRAGATSPDSAATDHESPPQPTQDDDDTPRRATSPPPPPVPPKTTDAEPKEQTQTQPPGKVKSWLRAKLTRQKPRDDADQQQQQPRGFVGGHGLRSPETGGSAGGVPSPSAQNVSSLASRIRHPHLEEAERARTPSLSGGREGEGEGPETGRREGEASEVGRQGEGEGPEAGRRASTGTDDMYEDATDGLPTPMTPPRVVGGVASGSPNRDSRFVEMMD